jgi:hypothetical protein
VLGPLLFILYLESLIHELEKNCKHTFVFAFADDLKLLGSNSCDLQKALDIIESWALKWDLCIQPSKSEHLFFPYSRNFSGPSTTFYMNQTQIPNSEHVRDLGIILSKNWKWSKYISSITTKANTTSYSILRAFQSSNYHVLLNLFKTYVRPTLEYNTNIWTPQLQSEIDRVESVQRTFTKRLCQRNNIKFSGYPERLKILGLESLEARRVKFDLLLMYKIYHNLIDLNFHDFFESSLSSKNYNLRGHDHQLHIPKYSGSTIREHFFSNRVLSLWNSLSTDLVNSETLSIFRAKLYELDIAAICTTTF